MYDKNQTVQLLRSLGNISGRVGPWIIRRVNGKLWVSGVPKDYRVPTGEDYENKIIKFGAAGKTAKEINRNPILKELWLNNFSDRKKRFHSIYNELTGIVFDKIRYESEDTLDPDLSKVCIVPEGGVKTGAIVSYFNGEIIVKPEMDEEWEAAAGIIVLSRPRKGAVNRRLIGDCRRRNDELRRKEEVRDERRRFAIKYKVLEECRRLQEDIALLNEGGFFTEERDGNLDKLRQVIKNGDLGIKKYLNRLMSDIREYLNIDYLPSIKETERIRKDIEEEEKVLNNEWLKLSAAYKKETVRKPRFMNRIFKAISVEFEKTEEGVFRSKPISGLTAAEENYEKYSVFLTLIKTGGEDKEKVWHDTIFIKGRTAVKTDIKAAAAVMVLLWKEIIQIRTRNFEVLRE